MDFELTLKHVISGYIPVIIVLSLYFIVLKAIGKKQTIPHIIASFIFGLYFVGICAETGIWFPPHFSPKLSLIPFIDMIRGPIDTVLNVILFIPLGLFLPLLYDRYDRISKVALTGFIISLSIEIIQLFGYGATDINDLITNTAGACLGFCIYKWLQKLNSESFDKTLHSKRISDYIEVAIFWICTLLMMPTIQYYIYHKIYR